MTRVAPVLLFLFSLSAWAAPAPLAHDEIVQALQESRFEHLEQRLNEIQQAFEAEPAEDRVLMESVWALYDLGDSQVLRQALTDWVNRSPESYAALLARGAYFTKLGLLARGTDYSSETSPRQFELMGHYFDLARTDLKKSLKLTEKPLGSYYELIVMAMRTGDDHEIDEYHGKVLGFAPLSMEIRMLYVNNLEPRWGGSFKKMETYIEESSRIVGPEKANRLRALLPAEKANVAREAKEYSKAYSLYSESIALRDNSYYRCKRAEVSANMKRFAETEADLQSAVAKDYVDEGCADAVARILCCMPQMPNVMEWADRMVERFPHHAELRTQRGWLLQEKGNWAMAYADYRVAAEQGHTWAQMQIGKYLFNGWGGIPIDREEALVWLKRAADKGELNAQYSLAEALAFLGRHEEAAEENKRYLEMKQEAAAAKTRKIEPTFPGKIFSGILWFQENQLLILLCVVLFALILVYFSQRKRE